MAENNKTTGTGENQPRPRSKPKKKRKWSMMSKVFGTLALIGVCTSAILVCFVATYIQGVIIPQAGIDASSFAMNLSSTIYYTDPETGLSQELRALHGEENRVLVTYDQLPEHLVQAAVAIEDKRFYEHNGVDWIRTSGAFVNMFLSMKDTFGGSTLTQQLIKNMTGNNEGTVQRKVLEIFSALEFERNYSKEEIIEMYMNSIYLGEGCYGVGTAAYAYFGKDVSELTLAECASLIGITNNPSAYNPYLSEYSRANNKRRQETIIDQMAHPDQGYITAAEAEEAKAVELQFLRGQDESRTTAVYSYYEDEVIRNVIADLQTELGISSNMASRMVYSGGLSIYSCYDPTIQSAVDTIYADRSNLDYTSASGQPLQSAITIMDNATGNVVALAGGVGEKTGSLTQNRAVATIRPPGSSIKPLAVYAPALELDMITPATVLDDSPYTALSGGWPTNSYSGYRGLTTVYTAMQNSVNTIATKIMGEYVTPMVAYDFITKNKDGVGGLGISTDHVIMAQEINGKIFSDIDIAPLALGGLTYGLSTYEMTAAYATFARAGVYVEPRVYTKVLDNDGNVILEKEQDTHTAMKESTAWYINDMLQNVVTSGTGVGAGISGQVVAGKTGTTTSRKDLWFAGYTPYYTAVVWTGYDQQEALVSWLKNPSVTMWQKVMSQVHKGLDYKKFAEPTNQRIVSVTVCKDSGLLPCDECSLDPRGSRLTTLKVVNGDQPTEYCDLHKKVEVCTASPILTSAGESTGLYRLVGPFCPSGDGENSTTKTIALVHYEKTEAEALANTTDYMYNYSYYESLGEAAYCTTHLEEMLDIPTEEEEEIPDFSVSGGSVTINPYDPSTWPDDPGFNPYDPTTWPDYAPEVTTPDTTEPEAVEPETVAPEVSEPEVETEIAPQVEAEVEAPTE